MGKLAVFLDTFYSWTGRSRRHNRALRDVRDWSAAVQQVLERYNLQEGSSDFGSVFENIGEAKLDLTTITYQTSEIIEIAKNVKGTRISPLIEEMHSHFADVRRALINPALSNEILDGVVSKLQESFKKLQDAISDIEFK